MRSKRENAAPIHKRRGKKSKARYGQRQPAQPGPPPPPAPDISNKVPDVSGVVASIPDMSATQSVELWKNALRTLSDRAKAVRHAGAKLVLRAVQVDWERREALLGIGADGFPWPSTKADGGSRNLSPDKWLNEGMLSFMGYHVGATNGKESAERQRILAAIFDGPLPPAFSRPYMIEWSRPGTPARLQKMAETIAALARNAKRRADVGMEGAIEDWEDDLDFLFRAFYRGRFRFGWPRSA